MSKDVQEKKKTGKKQHKEKSAKQYVRTAKNKARARAHHILLNPMDLKARADYARKPIRYSK